MFKHPEAPYSPFDRQPFSIIRRDRQKRLIICCSEPGFTRELLTAALTLSRQGLSPVIVQGKGFRQKVFPHDNLPDLCSALKRRMDRKHFKALRTNLCCCLTTDHAGTFSDVLCDDYDDAAPPARQSPRAAHGGAVRRHYAAPAQLGE